MLHGRRQRKSAPESTRQSHCLGRYVACSDINKLINAFSVVGSRQHYFPIARDPTTIALYGSNIYRLLIHSHVTDGVA